MPDGETGERDPEIERIFRQEYGRAVSVLIRTFSDPRPCTQSVNLCRASRSASIL